MGAFCQQKATTFEGCAEEPQLYKPLLESRVDRLHYISSRLPASSFILFCLTVSNKSHGGAVGCFVSCYGGLTRTVNVRVMYFKHEKLLVSSFKCHYYIKHILCLFKTLAKRHTQKNVKYSRRSTNTNTYTRLTAVVRSIAPCLRVRGLSVTQGFRVTQ